MLLAALLLPLLRRPPEGTDAELARRHVPAAIEELPQRAGAHRPAAPPHRRAVPDDPPRPGARSPDSVAAAGSLASFRRHPLFAEALAVFELSVEATGQHREALEAWRVGERARPTRRSASAEGGRRRRDGGGEGARALVARPVRVPGRHPRHDALSQTILGCATSPLPDPLKRPAVLTASSSSFRSVSRPAPVRARRTVWTALGADASRRLLLGLLRSAASERPSVPFLHPAAAQLPAHGSLREPGHRLGHAAASSTSPHAWSKVVERRRGGFCYELNTLFGWALQRLGFDVSLLSARVWRKPAAGLGSGVRPPGAARAGRGNDDFLADVGFGEAFRAPLPLPAGQRPPT